MLGIKAETRGYILSVCYSNVCCISESGRTFEIQNSSTTGMLTYIATCSQLSYRCSEVKDPNGWSRRQAESASKLLGLLHEGMEGGRGKAAISRQLNNTASSLFPTVYL